MEGAPIPSHYPPFPANPVVMNVVSQFTVYDSVLGDLEAPRLWQYYVSPRTSLQEEKGGQEGVGNPRVTMGGEGLIQLSVINNFLY